MRVDSSENICYLHSTGGINIMNTYAIEKKTLNSDNSLCCYHRQHFALRDEGVSSFVSTPSDKAGEQARTVIPRTIFGDGCGHLLEVWA